MQWRKQFSTPKYVLTLAFGTLWMLDTLFTAEFVREQGLQMEANPIVAWVIATYGINTFIVWKLVVLAVWFLLFNKVSIWVHIVLTALMLPVVYMGFLAATLI